MSKVKKVIPVNIWDDYYDDGFIPDGKKQSTNMYITNTELSHEERKKYLEFLLEYIQKNIKLQNVKMWMFYYDSKKKYPNLVGTENENLLFEHWEIKIENLSHERRELLVKELNKSKLFFNKIPFDIFSES